MIRAEDTAGCAGAYYVRIQAMARKHHISLHEEFDEHDGPPTRYIVLVDDFLPVATCRWYPLTDKTVMLGRIVVLPEYRGQGLGRRVVREAERWAAEMGCEEAVLDSRVGKTGFYEKLGYRICDGQVLHGETFDCIRMKRMIADGEADKRC